MLKYPIYIRSVTNLSDARYCAGMGVEMLGFCCEENQPGYVDTPLIKSMTGWISGVKVVAEFSNNPSQQTISDLNPDLVHVHAEANLSMIADASPFMYFFSLAEIPELLPPQGSYLLITGFDDMDHSKTEFLSSISRDFKLILGDGFTIQTMETLFSTLHLYGFSLMGGNEIAPGMRNFDELAEILEAIETDD